MHANIVLAGGGAKGAVLGGCLKACEDKGIRPVGFGGTSAGSIVAALASVGYSGEELKQLLVETDLTALLDDGGQRLRRLKEAIHDLTENIRNRSLLTCCRLASVDKLIGNELGLYEGTRFKSFLAEAIASKVDGVAASTVTFNELCERGCKPLRIVATDLKRKRAVIFGAGRKGGDQPVLQAVLASACYPFLFKPVRLENMLLADGGLSSNLPAFLFEEDYRQNRISTLAFDLMSSGATAPTNDVPLGKADFLQSLVTGSLEASDVLIRDSTPGVAYFPILTPEGIGTLDFFLTNEQRSRCFTQGYAQAAEKLEVHEPLVRAKVVGEELQKRLQKQYGPPRLFEPVLRAVVEQLDSVSPAELGNMRAHIMLLTGRTAANNASTRMVAYSIGMDSDPDADLELNDDAGCSGKAWQTGGVVVADLDAARANPAQWKMSNNQHNKVPTRIRSMISVPIPGNVHDSAAPERPVGMLSVDCEIPLADTGWCTDGQGNTPGVVTPDVVTVMRAWALVVGAILP